MIPEEIVFWTVERPLLNPSISSPVTHGLTHSLTLLCSVLTVLTSRVSKTKEMDCMNNMEGLLITTKGERLEGDEVIRYRDEVRRDLRRGRHGVGKARRERDGRLTHWKR